MTQLAGQWNSPVLSGVGLQSEIREAARQREINFEPAITLCYPRRTVPISLTGNACALNCAHCGGHYLRNMRDIAAARQLLQQKEAASVLVSGGCDPKGGLPLAGYAARIKELAGLGRINLHAAMTPLEDVQLILGDVAAVSFDLVGDDDTIRQVYNLPYRARDYRQHYLQLAKQVKTVPHICIGLRGGQLAGEEKLLDWLANDPPSALVFIVFKPTPGTMLANCRPPKLLDVAALLARARLALPTTPIYLGCMRPGGRYRLELDQLALTCGVNAIVMPAPAAVRQAQERNWRIRTSEECCVL